LSQNVKRPLNLLQKTINRQVTVRLKSKHEYRGKLSNVDAYMNVILSDAQEFNGDTHIANYGTLVIRGNNVLFVKIEDAI